MKKIFSTERLILREINLGDAPFIHELLNSEGWLEYIGDRGVKTLDDAREYIKKMYIQTYEEQGTGFYLMEKKDNGASIGMCGCAKRPQLELPDIGFSLLPNYYKKGYAYEAASATLKYAQDVLKLTEICAITTLENKNSQALLKKIGLTYEKMIPFSGEELMLFMYKKSS